MVQLPLHGGRPAVRPDASRSPRERLPSEPLHVTGLDKNGLEPRGPLAPSECLMQRAREKYQTALSQSQQHSRRISQSAATPVPMQRLKARSFRAPYLLPKSVKALVAASAGLKR